LDIGSTFSSVLLLELVAGGAAPALLEFVASAAPALLELVAGAALALLELVGAIVVCTGKEGGTGGGGSTSVGIGIGKLGGIGI
jgi:hypothetical protein